jgi:hypothetical protein
MTTLTHPVRRTTFPATTVPLRTKVAARAGASVPVEQLDPGGREAALDRALEARIADGWTVEHRTDFTATIAKGDAVPSWARMSVEDPLALGVWLVLWVVSRFSPSVKWRELTVDEFGNVADEKA